MTIQTYGTSAPARTHLAIGMLLTVRRWTLAIAAALIKAWRARQAAIALQNLGPEMLRDIGVAPCEIERVTRHGRPDRSAVRRPLGRHA